jgi:transposase-like protein
MRRSYTNTEVLATADLGLSLEELRDWSLEEVARAGAKMVLEVALSEEVAEFLGRGRYERSESVRGYRNGKRKRNIQTGCGVAEVLMPKVTGAAEPFRSSVLPAFKRKSEKLTETMALLYAEGLSTRDFGRALSGLWGKTGLTRSSVSRANKILYEQFGEWKRRDLSGDDVLYLFLDGVYLKMRIGNSPAEGALVAHGITREGRRVLLAVMLGGRESEDSWTALLLNMEERGLKPPSLVVSDGNPGLIKALKTLWRGVPRQRCTAHKTRNVLNRVPRKRHAEVKRELNKIFYAANLEEALQAVKSFAAKFGHVFPAACGTLRKDLEDCLTFYRYPQEHWKRIRTSNVIERAFKEVRRRTNVVGRFPTEASALTLIWATLEQDRLRWKGVIMDERILLAIEKAKEEANTEKIDLSILDIYLDAA